MRYLYNKSWPPEQPSVEPPNDLFNAVNRASNHVHIQDGPLSPMSFTDSVFNMATDLLLGNEKKTVWKTNKTAAPNSGRTLLYKTLSDAITWHEYEIHLDKVTHRYKQIAARDDKLCIFDMDRKFFLMLTNDFVYYGKVPVRENNFDAVIDSGAYSVFNSGTWVNFCLWKERVEEGDEPKQRISFKKFNSIIWHKMVNDEQMVNELEFVQSEKNEVILFDMNEALFFKLNSHEVLSGPSREACTTSLLKGDWFMD